MAGGFTICEYETVKQGFPEFRRVELAARNALLAKCSNDWAPLTYGGLQPRSGQFGETPIMPELFATRVGTTLTQWEQFFDATFAGFTIPGNNYILQASNGANTSGNGTLYEDYKIALCGLAFLDKAIKISEIKFQIGDKKYPRVNIEEAYAYNKPAIVFEDYFIIDEEVGFEMQGYVTCTGTQGIKLLGPQMNRVPNKLQVSNTGAALT